MLGFEDCLSRLGPVGVHVSPLDATEESTAVKFAAEGLRSLPTAGPGSRCGVRTSSSSTWTRSSPCRTAPCDLAIPSDSTPEVVVAAKGFDSTGSELTDAVREIEEMADVRLPRQTVYAVIDGIGWKSRQADLRRLHQLWETQQIHGMYTLSALDVFRQDLAEAARLRGLLP